MSFVPKLRESRRRAGRFSTIRVAAAVAVGTAAWLSLGILAVLDGDGVRVGVLPSVWVLAVSVLLAIVAAARPRLHRETWLPVLLSLLVVLPWIPLPVPDIFLVWTGPAALFVWTGIAVIFITVWARTARVQGLSIMRDPRMAPRVATALAFVAFLAVRQGSMGPPGGDEPHYLVIAQSLITDGDIKIANNYEQRDYLPYWGGFLRPHFSSQSVAGDLYSVHAPGLPLVVAPAFRVAGYRGVVVWVAVLVAIGSAFVWKAGYILARDAGAAWFAWAAVALTAPVVLHGKLVYPDPIAGTLLAGGTLGIVVIGERTRVAAGVQQGDERVIQWPRWDGWRMWPAFGLGVAVGLLPWLHTRLALPGVVLGCVLFLRFRTAVRVGIARWRDVAAFGLPIVLSLTGWFAFFWTIYGTLNPSVPYGDQMPLEVSRVATGLLSLLADQEFGMFPNAPIHVLWAVGLWSVFIRDRRLAVELLLIVGPYVIASSAYPVWFAGSSPPARFLVPVTFPLGVAFAALWARQDQRSRSMSLTLLGLSVLVAAALALGGDGGLAYNPGAGRARWLDWIAPLVDLPRAFPSYFRAGATLNPRASALVGHLVNPAILWGLSLLVGWGLFRALGRRLPDSKPVRALLAPCCLLIVFVLGVCTSWSLAGGVHVTTTRAQLRLLRSDDPRLRPLGVQLPPGRIFPAAQTRTRLELTTSRLDNPPPGALLFLGDVPSGDYVLRVTAQPSARGELFVGVGRATGAAWRWSIAGGQANTTTFRLPLPVSSLVVNGDEEAMRSVEKVVLTPTSQLEQQPHTTELRARDAARYGQVVVFTTDDRILLDLRGFWVMGQRQPEIIITTDSPINDVEMELRNVSIPNRVRLYAGRWSAERRLAPDEVWRVRVPVLGLGPSYAVRFEVEDGVPSTGGLLGCRVELR